MRRLLCICLSSLFLLPAPYLRAEEISPDGDDSVFISMTRDPDVVSDLPVNISVLNRSDIERLKVTNLPDALRSIPGVKIEGAGSEGSFSKIKIRGVPTSNHVQIVIDDQPLGGASIQNIDAALVPLEDVERIEVVRGGASNLYGANTIGGVIHVITKRAVRFRGVSVGYEGQRFDTDIHRTQVELKEGKADAMGTYRRLKSDGYQDDAQVDQEYASGNAGYTFSNGARVSADYSNLEQFQGLTSGTPVRFEDWDGHRERQSNGANSTIDKDSNRARARMEIPFSAMTFQASGGYSNDERETVTPFFFSKSQDEIWSGDSRVIFNSGFTGGFAYERDQREAFAQAPHHITNIAGYVEQSIKLSDWRFIPALRVDQHSLFGNEWNPRLSLVFTPSDLWKFSGNTARVVRAPTITDLFEDFPDTFGDPVNDFRHNSSLKPEVAWTYDLGFETRIMNGVVFNAGGFYSQIDDRITAIDSDGLINSFGSLTEDTLANLAKAEISGAEVGISMRTGFLSHGASYTYQRAKGTSPTSSEFVDLQFTPRHIANYSVQADLTRGYSLWNTLEYVSRQYERLNRQGTVLHPYAVWNAKLEKTWNVVSAFVGVDNVLNRLYGESVTFSRPVPQPTRTFRCGLSMALGE